MKVRSRLHMSPAMVVAMIALFIALSSSAVATTSALITGAQIKDNTIRGVDVRNKSLTPRDFKGSVRGPRGLPGAAGANGAKGDKGDKGDPGAAGTARAYAVVRTNVTFLTAYTRNFTSVQRVATGRYCLTPAPGIDSASSPSVVSPEYWNSSGSDFVAYAGIPSLVCPPGMYEVHTLAGSPPVPSNFVAFSIIVP